MQAHSQTRVTLKLEECFIQKCPIWKRIIDVIGSIVGLIIFLPLILLISIAIKLTSKGPVIFRQQRVGCGNCPFTIYKFRTMIIHAEHNMKDLLKLNEYDDYAFKMKDDPRINQIGRILRRWSLDELPQFFNVLIGNMSLVGPRPIPLSEAAAIENWHCTRDHVRPGITCLWQVWGRHKRDYNERMRMDIEYVKKCSFFLDLKILIMTAFMVFWGKRK